MHDSPLGCLSGVARRHLSVGNQHQGRVEHEASQGLGYHTEVSLALGSPDELRRFQEREAYNSSISVLTYEQVLQQGQAFLTLVERAADSEAIAAP